MHEAHGTAEVRGAPRGRGVRRRDDLDLVAEQLHDDALPGGDGHVAGSGAARTVEHEAPVVPPAHVQQRETRFLTLSQLTPLAVHEHPAAVPGETPGLDDGLGDVEGAGRLERVDVDGDE
ncbi:hypothetical protein STTU_0129 [Streptomyces sp. Tu6071]|nr:hypothetical protein STTU_0129 [Streptomyces sp. Tu6071]